MAVGGTVAHSAGFYPERDNAPEPLGDRVLAELGYLFHRYFVRTRSGKPELALSAARRAHQLEDDPILRRIPELRLRARREGCSDEVLVECAALYRAALARTGVRAPPSAALEAASVMLKGGIAQLRRVETRMHALGIASVAMVARGSPVHLVAASDARAARLQRTLEPALKALGIDIGRVRQGMDARSRAAAYSSPVVCGTVREIGTDYLRDRLSLGARGPRLLGNLERLAGDAPGQQLLLQGLHCALAEEAERVLLDDARAPLVISAEADESSERLNYEQAMELARALKEGEHFTFADEGVTFTEWGAERLERLVRPLGGIWAARQHREQLIGIALEALHRLERDRDYRVERGQVVFPEPDREDGEEEDDGTSELLRRLVEVKEGCRLSGRRVVLAKTVSPRFLRRYLHLGGMCADARGLEREFWALYRLRTWMIEPSVPRAEWPVRLFAVRDAKSNALRESIRAALDGGKSVLVAFRTPGELSASLAMLKTFEAFGGIAGVQGIDADAAALAALKRPKNVVATLYPGERNIERDPDPSTPIHLIVAELHDAGRHVEEIRESYGAETLEMLLALDDETMKSRVPGALARMAQAVVDGDREVRPSCAHWIFGRAQRAAEAALRAARAELMSAERQLGDLLAFSGARE